MYLQHHGIKGQKWGVRRYQNPDGSLTAEGKQRYGYETIQRGSTIRRISSVKEKQSTNPIGLYTFGEKSENDYKSMAKYLPSVNPTYGSSVRKAKVTQYRFTEDAKLLSGKDAVDAYMDMFGNRTLHSFAVDYGMNSSAYSISNIYDKAKDKKIKDIYRSMDDNEARKFAHTFIRQSMQEVIDEKDTRLKGQQFTSHFMKMGYDVIVDPEDFTANFTDSYIVMNKGILKKDGSYKFKW